MRHDSEEELSRRILLLNSPHAQAFYSTLNNTTHFCRIAQSLCGSEHLFFCCLHIKTGYEEGASGFELSPINLKADSVYPHLLVLTPQRIRQG